MSDVVKIAAAGIIAAVCAITVRRQVPELSILLAACAGFLILSGCTGAFSVIRSFMDELSGLGGLTSEVVTPVMKVTGIAMVTRISSDFCRDAEESALAATVEIAGGTVALVATLPLMSAVLKLIGDLL